MKTIVMDLFDTILDKVYFNYFDGLKFIYNKYISSLASYDALEAIANDFREKFMLNRSDTNIEVPFLRQLDWFEEHIDGLKFANKYEVEWEFFKASRKETISKNLKEFLSYSKKWGFELLILSNTIFSNVTLKRYLGEFGIEAYFKEIYSSADILYRKPSKKAFAYVVEKEQLNTNDYVFFIGNSLVKDIEPSKSLGFKSIFRNLDGAEYNEFSFIDYNELISYFEENYLYINSIMPTLSTVDGPGNRAVVFFQGCLKHCDGCHNSKSWSLANSNIISVADLATKLKNVALAGHITLTGGEPLLQPKGISNLLDKLVGYDCCLYTGYDYEEVNEEILNKLAYIKVGGFIKEKRSTSIPFIGSTNQKFINLKEVRENEAI